MTLTIAFIFCLLTACLGTAVFAVSRHLNALKSSSSDLAYEGLTDRYRPMLRLLAENDFRYLAGDGWTGAKLRQTRRERRQLFRCYLRSLTKDYARLIGGLRAHMLEADVDRPDLARAIAKNRALFVLSLLRIEFHLALHAAGVSNVDVAGLVEMVEALRSQTVPLFTPAAAVSLGAH